MYLCIWIQVETFTHPWKFLVKKIRNPQDRLKLCCRLYSDIQSIHGDQVTFTHACLILFKFLVASVICLQNFRSWPCYVSFDSFVDLNVHIQKCKMHDPQHWTNFYIPSAKFIPRSLMDVSRKIQSLPIGTIRFRDQKGNSTDCLHPTEFCAGSKEKSNLRIAFLCQHWRLEKMPAYMPAMEYLGNLTSLLLATEDFARLGRLRLILSCDLAIGKSEEKSKATIHPPQGRFIVVSVLIYLSVHQIVWGKRMSLCTQVVAFMMPWMDWKNKACSSTKYWANYRGKLKIQ